LTKEDLKQEAAKRKPRRKGQKRKSSKHSDLYTDEDPKGTIHGLGFKDAATARKGRAIINKARRKHAHKVQAALVMKQRAKVAKERTKDPEKKKNLNAAYKVWSEYLEKLKAKTKKMKKESAVISEDLSAIPSPSEWYQNALDYYGSKDSPGVDAVHDTLTAMENVPFASIPAGIMNAFIYHAKGQNRRALLSLGFSALGYGTARYLAKAIKNPGSAQKFFANLGHTGRKLAGKIKGHDFTILLRNPDAAQKAIATAALITPAVGEAAEDQINKLLDMSKEVHTELQRSQKLHDEFMKKFKKARYRRYDADAVRAKDKSGQMRHGLEDHGKQMSVPIDEKKRKHPRYRPPRKDPKTGKYDNPCGKGFAPGAQSGVKTKIGPQSGRRVSNCEPIKKKKNEAVLEAVLNRLLQDKNI
jgi:hypothetical protein